MRAWVLWALQAIQFQVARVNFLLIFKSWDSYQARWPLPPASSTRAVRLTTAMLVCADGVAQNHYLSIAEIKAALFEA